MSKDILVVGGAGFIGSVLCPKLRAAGHRVTIFDKKPRLDADASYVEGDVCDPAALSQAMAGRDLVYNLAAEHQDNVRPLSRYAQVNVEGARNLCAAADENNVRHLIFTSSVAVYGSHDVAINEEMPHRYFNEYGRTKHLAEKVYLDWLEDSDRNRLTIVRPTVVFGPGNRGNVYNFLRQVKYGPFVMFGDGRNVKSLAHVQNVASFLDYLAARPERLGVYNYADKPDFNMRELVRFIDCELGRASGYRNGLPRGLGMMAGRMADMVATATGRNLPISAVRVQKFCTSSEIDASRAMATGFVPPNDLRAGLQEMVRLYV